MRPPPECVVGVDLGGTKILAAVVDRHYRIRSRAKKNTKPERGPNGVIGRIIACIEEALDERDLTPRNIRAIGIGAPGMCDPDRGTVLFAPNLDWHNVRIAPRLAKRFGVPVFVDNDVNVGTLGVYDRELAHRRRAPRNVVGIFIGTGIGGGIVIGGKIFRGHNFTAGEIGHMIVNTNGPKCGCGNHGCLEAFAGRLALVRRIAAAERSAGDTPLHRLLAEDKTHKIKSGHIAQALRRRDPIVRRLVNEAAEHIGIAIVNIIHVLNPDAIVLGGGVMQAFGGYLMPRIEKSVKRHGIPSCTRGVQLLGTKLGDDAGIIGAAALAWQNLA